MIHYHGTPITPRSVLFELAGRNFCVPYSDPRDLEMCHQIGQSVMIDNGAFTLWKRNPIQNTPRSWSGYYEWVRPWLDYQTTWAVIPDVINGTPEDNDALLEEWDGQMGTEHYNVAPVWHLHEPIRRLLDLCGIYSKVCFGSSGQYSTVANGRWHGRVSEAFNELVKAYGRVPCWIHMLRGMSLSGSDYPFASVDSTDVARNHHVPGNNARRMVEKWDAQQCPATWTPQPTQGIMEAAQ